MEPAAPGRQVTGHALFNLWLAIGGGVAVPTGVGLFARLMVNNGDAALTDALRHAPITFDTTSTSANNWSADVESNPDRKPIAA
jgi:hypothetical protein